jgi:hypothetical protein
MYVAEVCVQLMLIGNHAERLVRGSVLVAGGGRKAYSLSAAIARVLAQQDRKVAYHE